MPYLAAAKSRGSPAVADKTPRLMPSEKHVARQVVANAKLWDELTEIARFHGDVFKAMDAAEGVSRNDIAVAFLEWAVENYWEDKGGKPTSKTEWSEKVKRYASTLLSERQAESEK